MKDDTVFSCLLPYSSVIFPAHQLKVIIFDYDIGSSCNSQFWSVVVHPFRVRFTTVECPALPYHILVGEILLVGK